MDNVKSEETTGLNRDLQSTIVVAAGFSLRCPRFAARVVRMEFRWKEQHWDRVFLSGYFGLLLALSFHQYIIFVHSLYVGSKQRIDPAQEGTFIKYS